MRLVGGLGFRPADCYGGNPDPIYRTPFPKLIVKNRGDSSPPTIWAIFASTGTCERRIAREVPLVHTEYVSLTPLLPAVWISSPHSASGIGVSP